jgi:hypothetical protein
MYSGEKKRVAPQVRFAFEISPNRARSSDM